MSSIFIVCLTFKYSNQRLFKPNLFFFYSWVLRAVFTHIGSLCCYDHTHIFSFNIPMCLRKILCVHSMVFISDLTSLSRVYGFRQPSSNNAPQGFGESVCYQVPPPFSLDIQTVLPSWVCGFLWLALFFTDLKAYPYTMASGVFLPECTKKEWNEILKATVIQIEMTYVFMLRKVLLWPRLATCRWGWPSLLSLWW